MKHAIGDVWILYEDGLDSDGTERCAKCAMKYFVVTDMDCVYLYGVSTHGLTLRRQEQSHPVVNMTSANTDCWTPRKATLEEKTLARLKGLI